MPNILLNDSDFRIIGGDERKFIAIPLSKWNELMIFISLLDEEQIDTYLDMDIQGVRIELED